MQITLPIANALISFFISVVCMFFSQTRMISNPAVIRLIEILFVFSVVAQLLICFYIKRQISKKNCQEMIKNEFPGNEREMSIAEYDTNQLYLMLYICLFHSLLFAFAARQAKLNILLMTMPFELAKNFFLSPLYQAHVLGLDVKRPFEKNVLFAPKETIALKQKNKKED